MLKWGEKVQILLDAGFPIVYNEHMKNMNNPPIENFDSSFSPNEKAEMFHNEPDCGACEDTGTIDEQIYCDCPMGDALAEHHAYTEEFHPCFEDECFS